MVYFGLKLDRSWLVLAVVLLITMEKKGHAQTTFEHLLEAQQQYQTAYAEAPKRATLRKLHKAEEELLDYLRQEGYQLKTTLSVSAVALPIYGQAYPALGEVLDSLKDEQIIKVFGKDKYGYYKVQTKGQIGYVYKLDQHLVHLDSYPIELVNKYVAIDNRVDAILSRPISHPMRKSSSPCSAIDHTGKACGIMNRNTSGRCHLH